MEALSPDDQHKLDVFMETAKKLLQEIDTMKESLRDDAKALSEEFGVKPKHLLAAARTAYKDDLQQKQDDMSTMQELLHATGHG